MKTFFDSRAVGVWVTLAFAAACGSDPKPDTETTGPGGDSSSGDESSSADPSGAETSAGEESSDAPSPSPSPGAGRPVLEELPPETPLSDLDDDQLAEVCAAYVATADEVNDTLGELCPAQAVFQATQGSPADTDDATFQALCAQQMSTCEAQVTEAQADTPEERCQSAGQCEASIEDFNACNLQIAALHENVLLPLSEQSVSECSETTFREGQALSSTMLFQFVLGLSAVQNETGGSPIDEDGPCQRINEACPELGVSFGAFSDLSSLLP